MGDDSQSASPDPPKQKHPLKLLLLSSLFPSQESRRGE